MNLRPIAAALGSRSALIRIIPKYDRIATSHIVCAILAAGCWVAVPAQAQTSDPSRQTTTAGARTQTFAISAQPLSGAIDAFIQSTGWQVGYSSDAAARAISPGVSGNMAPAQALRRLLGGSGLVARMTGPNTATLVPVSAQANPEPGAVAGAVMLDPISISGEKVARDYFRTLTSVGVVTGERIEKEQIQDIHEAINSTANALSTRASGNNSGITIRGINSEGLSQNQSANSAPVIAVLVDGAMQNAEAVRRGVRSVWDVEQVEVLRGPQSTLQGRNATAGAVVIKTKDPTYDWQAHGEQTFGTHNLSSTGVMLSGPLVANELAVRVAGQIQRSDMNIGYTDPANNVLGEDRFNNVRGKLLWEPAAMPGLRALFTIAHTDDRPGVNSVTGPDYFARVYSSDSSFADYRKTKTNNYVADISYAWSPMLKVRSITTYAGTLTDVNSAPSAPTYFRDDERKGGDFTQDLRVEIDNSGDGLSGVLGLFYGKFTTDTNSQIQVDGSVLGLGPGFLSLQNFESNNQTKSSAAYADLRYRIDRFAFIAGGRALRDQVSSRMTGTVLDAALLFAPPFTGERTLNDVTDETFTRFLPKLGATYDLTQNQTVGFTYSQGYRAGFADLFPFEGANYGIYRVQPETLDAYEVSYRSRWLNDTLSLNANFFYYDYRNQQVAFTPAGFNVLPGYSIIANASKSHSYGAEFEARYRFTENFTGYASIGLLSSHFDDIVVPETGNFSGNKFPEAPGYTVNVGGDYQDPRGWFIGANARFIDGFYSYGDLANTPARHVDNAMIVDARAGWEFKSTSPLVTSSKLTVFAKNLFNEDYLTYISNPSAGVRTASVGDTRQIGVSLSVKY